MNSRLLYPSESERMTELAEFQKPQEQPNALAYFFGGILWGVLMGAAVKYGPSLWRITQ